MERKNKIMLVAALCAVLVLVSSTVIRCTASHVSANEDSTATSEAASSSVQGDKQQETEASAAQEEVNRPSAKEEALTVLRSHAWQVEGDATRTISFSDGAFIESDEEGIVITAFEVENVTEGEGCGTLEVKLARDGVAEKMSTIIAIEGYEGNLKLTSDGFAKAQGYVQGSASERPVEATGLADPYIALIDNKTEALGTAIAQWCRNNAPTATQASFDGEVFLDTNNARTIATFSCDDAAKTIISVEYANGEFHVSG